MITLCLDTSHTWLVIGLIKDDQLIAKYQEKCWKKQSEELFVRLINLMDQCDLSSDDIDQIVVTRGPGSYTGVRIAMTVAKVFCAMRNLPIYTLSTLQLYAGLNKCIVVTDARGNRVYTASFDNGKAVSDEKAISIDELCLDNQSVIGDGHLVGKQDFWPDIAENFLNLKNQWVKAENVHLVVPEYLKSSASYLPNKK